MTRTATPPRKASTPIVTAKEIAERHSHEWKNGNRIADPFCLHSELELLPVIGGRTAYLCVGRPHEVTKLASCALARISKLGQQVVDQYRTKDGSGICFIAAEVEIDLPAVVPQPISDDDADRLALAKLRSWRKGGAK